MIDYAQMKREITAATAGFQRASVYQCSQFEGRNFMTPDIAGTFAFQKGKYIAEVSCGRGLGDYYIYGVTVKKRQDDGITYESVNDLCKCVFSPAEVRDELMALRDLQD